MPVYALDAIDDAVAPTRSLVGQLGLGDWLRLALVVPFVGGFGSVSFSANLPREAFRSLPGDLPAVAETWGVAGTAGLVVAAGLGLAAAYLVRSLLEFAFYEALRDGRVELRRSLRRWWLHGVQVWALRVALAWGFLASGSVAASTISAGGVAVAGVPGRRLAVATVLVHFAGYAVLAGFTTRFVVPMMIVGDAGVGTAWRRFLRTVAANPAQYAWYLLIAPLVRFVADVLALSMAVLVAAILAVPVVLFALPAVVVVSTDPALGLWPPLVLLTSGLALWYVVLVALGASAVRLPFLAYARYYALAVLRGTDPAMDLLA